MPYRMAVSRTNAEPGISHMRHPNNLTKARVHTTGLLKLLDKVGMTDEQKRQFLEGVKKKTEQKRADTSSTEPTK